MMRLIDSVVAFAALLLRVDADEKGAAATTQTTATFSITPDLLADSYDVEPTGDEIDAAGPDHTDQRDLLAWAATQRWTEANASQDASVVTVPSNTQFLIGVKSALIQGFSSRQLIRETWADRRQLPLGAHVVFLGCEPNVTAFNPDHQSQLLHGLQVEKSTYGDLLTHELACQDSYFSLVHKVKGFLRWTSQALLPALNFVMLADDDVYIRVDKLLPALVSHSSIPRQRFYAGQVLSTQFCRQQPIGRDASDKNAVSFHEYPMAHNPPFATGPHYLLSVDLVHFLANNFDFLRGVGTLEDVSVAFWLLALRQIRPFHIHEFENVRIRLCHNSLLAYADLTSEAMRRMHQNLRANRSFCDGFSFRQADKRTYDVVLPKLEIVDRHRCHREVRSLSHDYDLQYNVSAHTLQFHVTVSTASRNETASVMFKPTQHNIAQLCVSVYEAVVEKMPTTALRVEFCEEIHATLHRWLLGAKRESPASSHLSALGLSNLHHGTSSAAVQVILLTGVVHLRLVLECLLAVAFPDAHVEMIAEDEVTATSPDVVVASVNDVLAAGETFVIPQLSRLVLVSTADDFLAEVMKRLNRVPVLLVDSTAQTPDNTENHAYLPIASSSFAHRMRHSPKALLIPADVVKSLQRRSSVGFFASDDKNSTNMITAQAVITTALQQRNVLAAGPMDIIRSTPMVAFTLDGVVERCHDFKFAVIFEDHPDTPGYVGHDIVSAFLAGSIPIYYGHSPTVSWLFNPKAFIDCRTFDSMHQCAAHVAQVHASAELYEAMRREPPVVNHTAFMEVFSWHPDAMVDDKKEHSMAKRFKEMLMRV